MIDLSHDGSVVFLVKDEVDATLGRKPCKKIPNLFDLLRQQETPRAIVEAELVVPENTAPGHQNAYECGRITGIKVDNIRQEGLDLIKAAVDFHGPEVLKAAFQAELAGTANSEAVRMVYGSQAAADAFMLRLNEATTALMDRYPALAEGADSGADCSPTAQKIDVFFASFESINGTGATAQTDCEWIQYVACLAVCTSGGPVIYFPCAYLCWCAFCDNEVTEALCL